jgi:hypothetical protein
MTAHHKVPGSIIFTLTKGVKTIPASTAVTTLNIAVISYISTDAE